jgi:hypothetical protein
MATQRIILAKVSGATGVAARTLITSWPRTRGERPPPLSLREEIDGFVLKLRAGRADPSVVYYCEWIDRWSMGDDFYPSGYACGNEFALKCLSHHQARRLARRRRQFQEQRWLGARLLECLASWRPQIEITAPILLIRQALGPSADVTDIVQSRDEVAGWLSGAPKSPILESDPVAPGEPRRDVPRVLFMRIGLGGR